MGPQSKKSATKKEATPGTKKPKSGMSAGKGKGGAVRAKANAAERTGRDGAADEAQEAKPRVAVKNKLPAKQKEEFRQLLLRMRDRLSGQIVSLKNESLESNDWVNVEEDGTDVFDQQFALDIVSSENEMLLQIDEALERLIKGTYGSCEDCGDLVADRRLKALPFVRTCIDCQSKRETRGAVRMRVSERLEEM